MLRRVGIRGKLQVMERGVFLKRLQGGLTQWPGTQVILNGARIGGTLSKWDGTYMKNGGFNSPARTFGPPLDPEICRPLSPPQLDERPRLAHQSHPATLGNYHF